MSKLLAKARESVGLTGFAALALLAGAALFLALVVHPLQQRHDALSVPAPAASSAGGSGDKLAQFYRFLAESDPTTDSLARLHAIGTATGVEMRSATYSTRDAGSRLERYEMVLPLSGSYRQIRDFLKRALTEIPTLSLDQVSLKRETRTDGVVHAELRLTLHRVKS